MSESITIVVSHYVKPGLEQQFEMALHTVIEQAKQFSGYQGVQIIRPDSKSNQAYLLLIRFDNEVTYQAWEQSDIRRMWSQKLQTFIHKESQVRFQEGLEFWFSDPHTSTPVPPTKWKMAFLTWLVIYPLILLLSNVAGFYLGFLPPSVRLLLVSMTLVATMTYVLMPWITKTFAFWIFPKKLN